MKPTDDIRKLLSEKFENFEAEPQDASWDAIRFALDLKDKLDTYEAEPQEETWGEIKFAADLSKKFENYEAEPQTSTWENIQLATQLSSKFSTYETEPRAASWEIIKAAITPEKERRIVAWPFVFRVGIAASIALLLGFGWLLYGNNKENSLAEINNKNTQSTGNQGFNKNKSQDLTTNKSSETEKDNTEKGASGNKVDVSKSVMIEQVNDLSGIASNSKNKKNQGSNIKDLGEVSINNRIAKTIEKRRKVRLKTT
ncbi:MAG: hypothetical protein U5M51_15675 [Emticicia sp.]|nr:hypothetical protein [Emticicia sp.]